MVPGWQSRKTEKGRRPQTQDPLNTTGLALVSWGQAREAELAWWRERGRGIQRSDVSQLQVQRWGLSGRPPRGRKGRWENHDSPCGPQGPCTFWGKGESWAALGWGCPGFPPNSHWEVVRYFLHLLMKTWRSCPRSHSSEVLASGFEHGSSYLQGPCSFFLP